jgi:hypothetical protein
MRSAPTLETCVAVLTLEENLGNFARNPLESAHGNRFPIEHVRVLAEQGT